ncbi:MAG: response regulator [Desulfatitalea sp.]|nr:response regulator [Desulfatitalea sp.]NNK01869.1 response regulator [Desulfatitalea sp.]
MLPLQSNENFTILIVDDDETIRMMLKTGLQLVGFHCHAAEGAQPALKVLDNRQVDIVVADIRMPDVNGMDLLRIIKGKYSADVIIMTGYVDDFNYEDIVQQGASDFIQKPVRIAEFVARIKRVLSERTAKADRLNALTDLKLNLDKFQRAMEGIVKAISMAVEIRDPYTAGHQERVAELACAAAREMGLAEDDVYGLRMASVIHDLGKITVPAGILAKPGRLSPLEYELIKNHVQAGYDIMKQIEFPWPLANIILQHHERLDGSGYPQGLFDGDIMMQARILAVADVFETIASHRPYRPALGLTRAIDELKHHSGTLYDAQVVAVFLKLVDQGRFPEFARQP